MFSYEYEHSMDQKGRVSIPAAYRENLGEEFYICKGFDGCLFVFDIEGWKEYSKLISRKALSMGENRRIGRLLYSGSMKCTLDKQGRVLISELLRKHAKLKKNITFIGVGSRIEIWDSEEWNSYNDISDIDYNFIAKEVTKSEIEDEL